LLSTADIGRQNKEKIMQFRRSVLLPVALVAALGFILYGCSVSSDAAPSGSDAAGGSGGAVQTYVSAIERSAAEAAEAHQGAIDAIELASAGYTIDLSTEPAAESALGSYATTLAQTAAEYSDAFVAATQVSTAGLGTSSSALTVAPGFGRRDGPLLFTASIIVGTVALTGWASWRGIKSSVNKRAAPVAKKIQNANARELEIVRDELGLDPSTSKEDTLKAFNNLGTNKKMSKTRNLEAVLLEAANKESGVAHVDPIESRKAIAESSVKLGEVAVNATVSLSTTATGGQGYTEALQVTGLTQKAAQVVDLTITAISTVTDNPLQPLDVLASKLNVTVVSKAKTTASIARPSKIFTAAEAIAALNDPEASSEDEDAAAATLAHKVALEQADDLAPRTMPDGSIEVDIPDAVHTSSIDDPKNTQVLKIPMMPGDGKADILVSAAGKKTHVIEDVNTTGGASVDYPLGDESDGSGADATSSGDKGGRTIGGAYRECSQFEASHACDADECVPKSMLCDGTTQCTNGDDESEANCSSQLNCASPDVFVCDADTCIDKSKVCDDTADCANGLDESDTFCDSAIECDADEYPCNEFECVPDFNRCDGKVDCFFGEADEENCPIE
jgi:hypothetical protein